MADTAETIKKTADSAAKAQNQAQAHAAEFQAAGAKAMREGIDKSVASLTELNAHGKKNLDAMVESATVAQKGAEALSQQALGFAKTSWEDGVAAGHAAACLCFVHDTLPRRSTLREIRDSAPPLAPGV